MSLIPEMLAAYEFQSGLDIVRAAFRASVATMTQVREQAEKAHLDYVASGEDDREYEDGILVHSKEHELSHAEFEASIALGVVREAFVTSAFHYWERSARGWTGKHGKNQRFPIVAAAVSEIYGVHPRLKDVNKLNNLLKHNSAQNDEELSADWPELFRSLFPQREDGPLVKKRLVITDAIVEEVFGIVAASGPQYPVEQDG